MYRHVDTSTRQKQQQQQQKDMKNMEGSQMINYRKKQLDDDHKTS